MRAVVFAYHNVGVRCIQVLLARGVEIALVVTHHDNPNELIWFESVAALCAEKNIPCVMPDDPTDPSLQKQITEIRPQLIFSFYYRHMLPIQLLSQASAGAFNMHGSLLPKYRGRVPINWAVLHGEEKTGATLHEMVAKPDAGSIVAQTAIPILRDDTAHEVFGKVVVAAEMTLWNVLPEILAGHTPHLPNILAEGSYFGGRRPADGCIDWQQTAQQIYNLHRAVAPPYPGAWTVLGDVTYIIGVARLSTRSFPSMRPGLTVVDNKIVGIAGDGNALAISSLLRDGSPVTANELLQHMSS